MRNKGSIVWILLFSATIIGVCYVTWQMWTLGAGGAGIAASFGAFILFLEGILFYRWKANHPMYRHLPDGYGWLVIAVGGMATFLICIYLRALWDWVYFIFLPVIFAFSMALPVMSARTKDLFWQALGTTGSALTFFLLILVGIGTDILRDFYDLSAGRTGLASTIAIIGTVLFVAMMSYVLKVRFEQRADKEKVYKKIIVGTTICVGVVFVLGIAIV